MILNKSTFANTPTTKLPVWRTWGDKSSRRNANATQDNASSLPSVVDSAFNGLSAVQFDGTDFMDVNESAFDMLQNVQSATLIGVMSTDLSSSRRGLRALMVSSGSSSAASRAGINLFDSFGASIGGSGDFGLQAADWTPMTFNESKAEALCLATCSV